MMGFGGALAAPVHNVPKQSMSFWHELGIAVSLVLILEGILPFLAPGSWRNVILAVSAESDQNLRIFGLMLMLAGLGLLYLVN